MKISDIVTEASLGNYVTKATKDKALNQMSAAFGRDDTERAMGKEKARRREQGLARAKPRLAKARADISAKAQADSLAADKAGLDQMRASLAQLEKRFDPNYQYSDDYSFWKTQEDLSQQIGRLKDRIARASA
jgi:hypothetical protein